MGKPIGLPIGALEVIMDNIPIELPKTLRLKGRAASLIISVGAALLLAAFAVLILVFGGGSKAGRITGCILAAGFFVLTVLGTIDAIRLFSVRVVLEEESFTYHIFLKEDRVFPYSDFVSKRWSSRYAGRRPVKNWPIELSMKDGSKLLVDDAMMKGGLGAKLGVYDELVKNSL